MFHLVAYGQNAVPPTTLTAVPALADQSLAINANNVVVPGGMNQIMMAEGIGATLARVQLQSPSLRRLLNLEVTQLDVTPAGGTGQLRGDPRYLNPIVLDPNEQLVSLITGTSGTAEIDEVLVWLTDGNLTSIRGDIRTVRATGATTLVAGAWTLTPLTFDQTLPSGQYQVVGLRARGATLRAARLVIPGQQWRPGVSGLVNAQDWDLPFFRQGGLGSWGVFNNVSLFQVECLAQAADASQTLEIDVLKVA